MQLLKRWLWRALLSILVVMFAAGLAYSFPADMAFLLALDLATWAEAAIAVYVVTTVTKVRPLMTYLRARFGRRKLGSTRQSRSPAVNRRVASNDEGKDRPTLFAA